MAYINAIDHHNPEDSMNTTRKTTAAEAYAAEQQRIAATLERIQAKLQAHATKAAADPRNWGYHGDLAHVRDLLEQAEQGLGAA